MITAKWKIETSPGRAHLTMKHRGTAVGTWGPEGILAIANQSSTNKIKVMRNFSGEENDVGKLYGLVGSNETRVFCVVKSEGVFILPENLGETSHGIFEFLPHTYAS